MTILPMDPSAFETPLLEHPEHLKAIGIITIELATMELLLAALMGGLINVDVKTADAIFTTPKSSIARLDLITNILAIRPELPAFFKEEIEKVVSKARRIMGRRHTLVHNLWGASPDGVHSIVFNKGDRKIKPLPIGELNDLINDIRENSARIINIRVLVSEQP